MADELWRFEALDRLFFRDGRPFNAGESAWLESQFPPTGQTLQGAVRAALLVNLDADFEKFRHGQPCVGDVQGGLRSLTDQLGKDDSLGKLVLTGPFVLKGGQPMFPAPLDLVKTDTGGYELLCVDENNPIDCDLGTVCLPRARVSGVRAQDGKYLTVIAMAGYLAGNVKGVREPLRLSDAAAGLWPLFAEKYDQPALADREPKIGLERDDATRTAKESMLYSISFVRPRRDVSFGLMVSGLDSQNTLTGRRLQALGGEGKLAGIEIIEDPPTVGPDMPALTVQNGWLRFKLVLTTPALFANDGVRWLPEEFDKASSGDAIVWCGALSGNAGTRICDVTIISACVGKPQKVGGWNLAANAPRPLTGYIPAGSVYFCRAPEGEITNIRHMHRQKIGLKTEYGFGHVLIGAW